MGEADDVYQAFSNVVSEDSGNVISDENNRNLQYKDIYNIHVPKARDKIGLDIDSIEKLQKECKKIKEAKYPYAEICLGIASLLLGAFLSASISQVTYELKFLSVLFYSICPVGGIGCSVAYWFYRRDKDAMQIRRGYRGGNEVKHNIFDSRLSNTVLGKEEKKKLINVVLSKIATNIK